MISHDQMDFDRLFFEEMLQVEAPETCWRCIPGKCENCKDIWVWGREGYVVYKEHTHTKRCYIWYAQHHGELPAEDGNKRYHLHHYTKDTEGQWSKTDDDCVVAITKEEHTRIHNNSGREWKSGDGHWVRCSIKQGVPLAMHSEEAAQKRKLTLPRGNNHHIHKSIDEGTHLFITNNPSSVAKGENHWSRGNQDWTKSEKICKMVAFLETIDHPVKITKEMCLELGYYNTAKICNSVLKLSKVFPHLSDVQARRESHGVWWIERVQGEQK